MNRYVWRYLSFLLIAFALVGCGTFEDRNFGAIQQGTKTQVRADRAGACFGLDRSVPPPPRSPAADEVQFGYENHLARGADPFPCNHRTNYDHQAAVKFDLSSYPADAVLTAATLEVDVNFIPLMPVTEFTRDCQSLFQVALEAWADGNFMGPTTDPRAHVASDGTTTFSQVGGRTSLNVLTIVRSWVAGRRPNQGFTFSGPREHSFAEENLSCVSTLKNWNLKVTRFIPDSP